jgi:glutathione S-transferase
MPDDYKETVKKALASRQLPFVERSLAGKEYLLGSFSVADGYLFTVLRWTDIHKMDLSGFPNIATFMKRMAARPAVQDAMKAEGLIK